MKNKVYPDFDSAVADRMKRPGEVLERLVHHLHVPPPALSVGRGEGLPVDPAPTCLAAVHTGLNPLPDGPWACRATRRMTPTRVPTLRDS